MPRRSFFVCKLLDTCWAVSPFSQLILHETDRMELWPLRGGFLPVFWDVPRADTHAVEDIGAVVEWLTERCSFHADAKSNLAVLHNRNDMTTLFRASDWVSFFELMPCALEALTVIKTLCFRLAIPTYWRIGESKKPGVFQKTDNTKNEPNQKQNKDNTRRHPGN